MFHEIMIMTHSAQNGRSIRKRSIFLISVRASFDVCAEDDDVILEFG